MATIRDLLYFDFDKAASIWSQFHGGLREKISITEDQDKGQEAGVKFGIPKIAEARLGVQYGDKRSILETKVLHHDLLNLLDTQLCSEGLVADLNGAVTEPEPSADAIREAIGTRPYLKAQGWSVIEDYRRFLSITERFKDLTEFIALCSMEALKQSSEYLQVQTTLEAARAEASSMKDRNKKAIAQSRVKSIEDSIKKTMKSQLATPDQWIIDGLRLMINTFMPNRINFRIYPVPICPSFQVICNLKRECFVDQDLEHLLYGYGNRANVLLSVFGLITSIPPKSGSLFDPMAEFQSMETIPEKINIEKGLRTVFGAIDELESYFKFSRYPNVTVHPIAVFREFEGKDAEGKCG